MNDLDLLDRFGPEPTQLSDTAMAAARARLDVRMADTAGSTSRPHRRLSLLAAAAAAVVGLAVAPSLIGSDGSIALAAVDPMTFPLTPTALPSDVGDPVFERDRGFIAARYGSALDGVSVVTDVDEEDFWAVPENASTTDISGHRAVVVHRTVHDGTPDDAPAVTIIWHGAHDWTAVTGSGSHADVSQVEAIAESLRDQPQRVDLSVSVAPEGWAVVFYKDDRILTLAAPGDDGAELTVSLVDQLHGSLSGYGAHDTETVTINEAPAQLGRRAAEGSGSSWIVEARTSSGQPFSLQAPASLTREQVIRIAGSVSYRS